MTEPKMPLDEAPAAPVDEESVVFIPMFRVQPACDAGEVVEDPVFELHLMDCDQEGVSHARYAHRVREFFPDYSLARCLKILQDTPFPIATGTMAEIQETHERALRCELTVKLVRLERYLPLEKVLSMAAKITKETIYNDAQRRHNLLRDEVEEMEKALSARKQEVHKAYDVMMDALVDWKGEQLTATEISALQTLWTEHKQGRGFTVPSPIPANYQGPTVRTLQRLHTIGLTTPEESYRWAICRRYGLTHRGQKWCQSHLEAPVP